jgi:SAM-dependent methyltransferase
MLFVVKKIYFSLCQTFPFLNRATYFKFKNEEFKFFISTYNNTWDNERGVEVAIFKKFLDDGIKDHKRILEIGNVLNKYFTEKKWDIVDKFEKAVGVINEDIAEYTPPKKYDMILSISTLEHVGFDDDSVDPEVVDRALENIKSMLNIGGVFVFSDPLGYNKAWDKKIFENSYDLDDIIYLKRTGYRDWVESSLLSVAGVEYDFPYSNANALAICFYKKIK